MNAQAWLPTSGVNRPRCASHLRDTFPRRARVAVFGSFVGGIHVLKELLSGGLADRVTVVGIATDDPAQPFTNAKARLWKYPHTLEDEWLVRKFAAEDDLPLFTGNVKSPDFCATLENEWQPELCLMATFGQKIPNRIIELPRLGFFNFHHSGPAWPSYPGPDPIAAMQRDGRKNLVLTMHRVTDVIDGGEFVARSHRVAIPEGVNAIEMHRITWPQMGGFICRAVEQVLNAAEIHSGDDESLMLHDEPATYFVNEYAAGQDRARPIGGHFMAGLRL